MGVGKFLLGTIAMLAASAGGGGVVAAQCLLCAGVPGPVDAKADIPLRIEIGAPLDFNRLAANGTGGGSVVIDPNGGGRIGSPGLTGLGGLFGAGSVTVRGEPHRAIIVTYPCPWPCGQREAGPRRSAS